MTTESNTVLIYTDNVGLAYRYQSESGSIDDTSDLARIADMIKAYDRIELEVDDLKREIDRLPAVSLTKREMHMCAALVDAAMNGTELCAGSTCGSTYEWLKDMTTLTFYLDGQELHYRHWRESGTVDNLADLSDLALLLSADDRVESTPGLDLLHEVERLPRGRMNSCERRRAGALLEAAISGNAPNRENLCSTSEPSQTLPEPTTMHAWISSLLN